MADQKVVPMKKRFRPNLAFFLFLIILGYVIFLGWNYLTKEHVSIYEVNATEISDDSPLYGFILRSEKVITTDTGGYVNYYNAAGNRVGAGKVIYTVDPDGELTSVIEKLQNNTTDKESISAVRESIAVFQNSFSLSDYQQVKNFSTSIDSVLFESSRGNLFQNLNKQIKSEGIGKNFKKGISEKSGVIVYSVDGYEDITLDNITPELFDKYASVTKKQLQNNEQVAAGDPVCKLITSNNWSLIVQLDDMMYQELSSLDYVRVTIDKDEMSFNAKVSLFDKNGTHFAKLQTARFMEHYINDRFLKLEINLTSASGLKIPNSSILEKDFYVLPADAVSNKQGSTGVVKQKVGDDGKTTSSFVSLSNCFNVGEKYYVSSEELSPGDVLIGANQGQTYIVGEREKLSGVYCVNKGYCEFRRIETVYRNKEYTIVSDSTSGGLSTYDHIVVDPVNLSDDDFIK